MDDEGIGNRMPTSTRTDRFWSYLVWPLLWPFLLAQAVLVLLCLVLGLFLWLAMPDPVSWAASGWLLVALLIGTTLTTTAFLLQLRHRMREYEGQANDGLRRVERHLLAAGRVLPPWLGLPAQPVAGDVSPGERLDHLQDSAAQLQACLHEMPSVVGLMASASRPSLLLHHEQIVNANLAMEKLLGKSIEALRGCDALHYCQAHHGPDGSLQEMSLRDVEGSWHRLSVERLEAPPYQLLRFMPTSERLPQLGNLVASRERAREDSRLKSRYLALLQRELEPLLDELAGNLEVARSGFNDKRLAILHDRMADISLLVSSLVDDGERPTSHEEHLANPVVTLRVLVVDDGPVNRMLAGQVLEEQGCIVTSVASGHEALEQQQRQPFDLVLLDIYMPDMSGLEVARRWRDQEARQQAERAVLVALTANASEVDQESFLDSGMDDYLAKPYGPKALVQLLRQWHPGNHEEKTPQ